MTQEEIVDLSMQTDEALQDRVPCYGQSWDPKESACNTRCGLQARCAHFMATCRIPETAGMLGGTVLDLLAMPDDVLGAHLAVEAHTAGYLKAYNQNPQLGLPIVGPDGQLVPTNSGPPATPDQPDVVAQAREALKEIEESSAEPPEEYEEEPEMIIEEDLEGSEEELEDVLESAVEALAESEAASKRRTAKKRSTQKSATKAPVKKAQKGTAKKRSTKKSTTTKRITERAPKKDAKRATKSAAKEKTATKRSTKKKEGHSSWGPETFVKRFEKERKRYPKLQNMRAGQSVGTVYKGTEYKAKMLKDGWDFGGTRYATLYAVQLAIQGGGREYPAQERENGVRPDTTRVMASMSVNRFWGLTEPKKRGAR